MGFPNAEILNHRLSCLSDRHSSFPVNENAQQSTNANSVKYNLKPRTDSHAFQIFGFTSIISGRLLCSYIS